MAVRSLPPASPTAAPLWRGDVYEAIGCCKHSEEYTLALCPYGLGGCSPRRWCQQALQFVFLLVLPAVPSQLVFALLRCQSLKQGLRRWPTPGPQCDSLSPGAAAEAAEAGDVTGQAARRKWREALRHAKQRRLFNARLLRGGHRD